MNSYEPQSLSEMPGQQEAKEQLSWALAASKKTGKAMPHIILYGPAGVGKTTMANLIAKELGTRCKVVDARNLKTQDQFIQLVSDLGHNDVLFVDEIHGIDKDLEELLYGVVDNFGYYHTIGKKQYWVPLNRFVLVGATTKYGDLSAPLRTRFGITAHLNSYDEDTLAEMAIQTAARMGLLMTEDAAMMVATSSRGVARTMTKLLDRCDDVARVQDTRLVNEQVVRKVMNMFGIDDDGLNAVDRKLMQTIAKLYNNQPVGLSTLAASMGENEDTLSETVEPFLLKKGYLVRTPRGRMLSKYGLEVAA